MGHGTRTFATATAALMSTSGTAVAVEPLTSPDGRTALTWYGQLNPAIVSFDDGGETTTRFTDNASSNSRVGFNMDTEFEGSGDLRLTFETALGFRQSSGISQDTTPQGWRYERTDLRKLELVWTAEYGRFSVGQGSMASDGAAGNDFSGVGLTNGVSVSDPVGSFRFRETDGTLSGIAVSDVFSDLDGGRRARLRYDTPSFSGVTFGAAYGVNVLTSEDEDTYYDLAVRYDGETETAKFGAALAYAVRDRDSGEDDETLVGSASVLLASGLNFAIAAGSEQGAGDSGSYYYLKAGWIGNFWSVGSSSFAIDYSDSSDFNGSDDKATALGLAYTQKLDAYGLEGYLGYRTYTLEDASASYQDASSVFFGSRWRF